MPQKTKIIILLIAGLLVAVVLPIAVFPLVRNGEDRPDTESENNKATVSTSTQGSFQNDDEEVPVEIFLPGSETVPEKEEIKAVSKKTYSIDVEWPEAGRRVGDTELFRAAVPGLDIRDYEMYWQVEDDGQLNHMVDSYASYPHKEKIVDTSPWTWKRDGKYNIYFTAIKDGSVIARTVVVMTGIPNTR